MNKLYKIAFCFSVISFILTSCKKFVEIPPPTNQLDTTAVFSDSASATAAIRGIYIAMMQNFALNLTTGGLSIYTGLSSDELIPTAKNTNEEDFYKNSLIAGNTINYLQFWSHGYRLIYMTNASIEGIEKSQNLTELVKAKLSGEAHFLRASLYFYLTNLYGPVPLPIATDYRINMALARSTSDLVYGQIINDLQIAEKSLVPAYPTAGRFRVNQYAAKALLARVYLYQEKWREAENKANEVINSGIYVLETDLSKVFLSKSSESIWNLSPVFPGKETWEGHFVIPTTTSAIPKYVLTVSLLDAFETGDKRKITWTNKNTNNGTGNFYPYKYKLKSTTTTPVEANIVLRLAETYLIRAEARALQNKLDGAISDLNILRRRAGLADVPISLNQQQVFDAVSKERRTELFTEWGHRWFDLKRTGQASKVLQPLKALWQDSDVLYPIPDTELQNNPYMVQNKGY
jgi:hypothetical protein